MLSTYECMLPGNTLREQSHPILKQDHPESDDLEFISEEDQAKYMSMISMAQWLFTVGRFDITITMSTLSSYRVAPQKEHLKCMKQLNGYVKHFPRLLYVFIQTFLTTVKWYMNPMNGYT